MVRESGQKVPGALSTSKTGDSSIYASPTTSAKSRLSGVLRRPAGRRTGSIRLFLSLAGGNQAFQCLAIGAPDDTLLGYQAINQFRGGHIEGRIPGPRAVRDGRQAAPAGHLARVPFLDEDRLAAGRGRIEGRGRGGDVERDLVAIGQSVARLPAVRELVAGHSAALLRRLVPLCAELGVRIGVENHEYETAADLRRIITSETFCSGI